MITEQKLKKSVDSILFSMESALFCITCNFDKLGIDIRKINSCNSNCLNYNYRIDV